MLELGPDEERLHRAIGARAAGVVDALVAVGERGRWIAEGARDAGLARVSTAPTPTRRSWWSSATWRPGSGDLLLVKGSRGIALDRLVGGARRRGAD